MTPADNAPAFNDPSGAAPTPPAIVVMGVSGCGKSTVGQQLAQQLGWRFVDADDFHPSANIEKMRVGIPLTDDDRWPWLERLNALMRHSHSKGESVVLACSALRQTYRDTLADRLDGLRFVHLSGDFDTIMARAQTRQHDYMPASLLRSQFDTLEPPLHAWTFDIDQPVAEIVAAVLVQLRRPAIG